MPADANGPPFGFRPAPSIAFPIRMGNFKTLDLAIEFYDQILLINAKGNLKDQLLRAASSISLNLSFRGKRQRHRERQTSLFQVAYGSLRECQTIFRLMKVEDGKTLKMADHLGASLYKLINSHLKDSPN